MCYGCKLARKPERRAPLRRYTRARKPGIRHLRNARHRNIANHIALLALHYWHDAKQGFEIWNMRYANLCCAGRGVVRRKCTLHHELQSMTQHPEAASAATLHKHIPAWAASTTHCMYSTLRCTTYKHQACHQRGPSCHSGNHGCTERLVDHLDLCADKHYSNASLAQQLQWRLQHGASGVTQ